MVPRYFADFMVENEKQHGNLGSQVKEVNGDVAHLRMQIDGLQKQVDKNTSMLRNGLIFVGAVTAGGTTSSITQFFI